ncbi:MAG: prepilin-type N-terminal cleavage/methylation domain-containing protein [Bdellovibrionales bacterium]|nr:prepilin-type N-terminal cleavage/methylation domain-containing protein [Bdellovibrionales bacterium]
MKKFNNAKGFSLIELMIVVAIIGILAAIAVPSFQRFQAKARQSEAKTLLSGLYTGQKTYKMEWGIYFSDFRNIGFDPNGNLRFRVGFSAAGVNNVVGYQGPGAAAGAAGVQFNSQVYCGASPSCTETPFGIGMAAIAGDTPPTTTTFVAQANGDIDGEDAVRDIWTINQDKLLLNPTSDL